MTSVRYLARVRKVLSERGWTESISPAELLDRWAALVDAAEAGYGWTLDEYLNELLPRDVLEDVLADPDLETDADVQQLRERVLEVDQRLRGLLRDDVWIGETADPWWRRGVLRFAGSDYVDDLRGIYGITVEVEAF